MGKLVEQSLPNSMMFQCLSIILLRLTFSGSNWEIRTVLYSSTVILVSF